MEDEAHLARLVADALGGALAHFSIYTPDDPKTSAKLQFYRVAIEGLSPGSASGQIASKGFYPSPHVTTSDGAAASLVTDVKAFRDLLRAGADLNKPTELRRGFAPLVSKINAGKATPSNPRTSLLQAALTALATVAHEKPAAWNGANAALIPDLPLEAEGDAPLITFVRLFDTFAAAYQREGSLIGKVSLKGGYRRPPLHDGNFPGASPFGTLGTVGLVAALGRWARDGENVALFDGAVRPVLDGLADRPVYVVSYDNLGASGRSAAQERYGHHLVGLAFDADLDRILGDLYRTRPIGEDDYRSPKVELFRMMTDRFLRHFSQAAFHDFLAFRAEYPASFAPVLLAYFAPDTPMPDRTPISPELVASARAYGATLNFAAYRAARQEVQDDEKKRGAALRTQDIYKQRMLVEFESAIQSARSGPELLAKVGSRVGRLTGFDFPAEAREFMEAVAAGAPGGLSLADAQDLTMAFLRLSSRRLKASVVNEGDDTEGAAPDEEAEGVEVDDRPPHERHQD
ncbi:MAG TPA: hypothetical protein VK610_04100 [Rhodothermales bacterium]|nr:hypothetical protein [Rhodothermales bacterium]